jgi:hypothetical protein
MSIEKNAHHGAEYTRHAMLKKYSLIKIEHNVQLTHVRKVWIQQLHKQMYALQITQFVILYVHGDGKEQTRISPVDQFIIVVFNEICVFFIARRD